MIFRRLFGARRERPDEPAARVDHFDSPEEGDHLIVEQLRSMGADLSKAREVLHYLYLPTAEAADAARRELEGRGYAVEVRPAAQAGSNPWLCLATAQEVVSVQSARASRQSFSALAATLGGEYDGWEAAGTP